ncbi:MAG: AI-2E family transporter, partial [Rhizobacter sp.]|nr:AI-2E family transporter [Rhizobacter sp.]
QVLSWASTASDAKLPWERIASIASASASAVGDVLLALLLGLYLAVDPDLYREGFLRLLPRERRADIGSALTESGRALQGWMLGQALTMLIVGATVAIGLAALGMPMAAAIGVLSGLFEFVPFFGAIAWAVLATLLAFAQGPERALYVGIFCFAVQQLEGNFVTPMVQRWAVHLPPVLSLAAVVLFGTLFGVAGIVLGTPLMVVAVVLVRKLWVDRLG